ILARSQIFTPDAVLPVVLPLNIRGRTVQTVIAVYLRCGLRCRPCIFRSMSGCRVGTAKTSPHSEEENIMTIAYRFMHRHTRNTLVARGWPANMDIDTSLNYSRGEGVAFYGQLDALQLQRLLPEIALRGLMSDQAMKVLLPLLAGSELIVRLYRNSLGHRKAHAGTISLEYDNCPEGMSTKHILCLLKALRDEINHVCSCVASAGYRLMEALRPAAKPLVFTRRTRNFLLTVTEVEQVQDDAQWDNETLDARLKAVLDGKETFRRLQIRLECNGRTVGQTHVPYALRHPDSPSRDWFDRHWLRDVVSSARTEIDAMMKSFSGIRIAA
ncbi:hypothetical protein, partial [Enterobacter hormaechei]